MSNTTASSEPRTGVSRRLHFLSKRRFLSTDDCKQDGPQQARQRQRDALSKRCRPVSKSYLMRSRGNNYSAQREVHFINLRGAAIHDGIPTGIVSIGQHHHSIARHLSLQLDPLSLILRHRYLLLGASGLRAGATHVPRRISLEQSLTSQ